MYLGPHHFQAQNRYFEDSIRFATSALWFEPYGLLGCQMDSDALSNGIASLIHARGILPDGLSFHFPDCDALPDQRPIADLFPVARDKLTILLAIPERKHNGVNCVLADPAKPDGPAASRFTAESSIIWDEVSGRDEKPVRMGRKNFRLLLDTEPANGCVTIPIARAMRDGSGRFVYDPSFIPPALHLGASDRLLDLLHRMVETLEEKSDHLGSNKMGGARTWAEYATRDIANFWMLHTINEALAPLRHHLRAKRGHPEELYKEMARLAGALCTFRIDSHPRAVPAYDHTNLDRTFELLDTHIRLHLETMMPSNCISIPLTKRAEYFYEGKIADDRCLHKSRWIFAIKAAAGEVEILHNTPRLAKICSKSYLPKLVERALPGLALTHLPVPPASITTRVDTQYFSLNKTGPCWDNILQTKQIGVYVPGELPEPEIELLVVIES